jgi:hypothetical protein
LWATAVVGNSWGHAVTTHSDGSATVTGWFMGTVRAGDYSLSGAGGFDIFVGRISAQGQWLWAVKVDGTEYDSGWDVAATPDGGAIVTGSFGRTVTFGAQQLTSAFGGHFYNDAFVAKVSSTGEWLWAKNFGGFGDDDGYGVSVFSDGSAVVTGRFAGTMTLDSINISSVNDQWYDAFVAKISSSGNWIYGTNAGSGTDDFSGRSVTALSDGTAVVTGDLPSAALFGSHQLNGFSSHTGIFVAKIGTTGQWQWATSAGGTNGHLQSFSITRGPSNSLYVVGTITSTVAFSDITATSAHIDPDAFIAKMASTGQWEWVSVSGGEGTTSTSTRGDEATGLAILSDGSMIVVGSFIGNMQIGSTSLAADWRRSEYPFATKISASGVYLNF